MLVESSGLSGGEGDYLDDTDMNAETIVQSFRAHTLAWTIDRPTDSVQVCAICLDSFETGQEATRLACFHMYHTACIEAWVSRSESYACPDCQHDATQLTTTRELSPQQTMPESPEHH